MPLNEARRRLVLEESVREAARLLQGPAVASDRDVPPLRFWTLAGLLGIDPRAIGDRRYVAEIDGVVRKSEGEGTMAIIKTLMPATDVTFIADPTTKTMTLTLNLGMQDEDDEPVSLTLTLSTEEAERIEDELGMGLLPGSWFDEREARERQRLEAKKLAEGSNA